MIRVTIRIAVFVTHSGWSDMSMSIAIIRMTT